MGETRCQLLFPVGALNHPEISREMKDTFIPLAGRAGHPDEIDSCDMESYYEEHRVPPQQRHSSQGYFLGQTLDRDGYAQLDFDYKKFFAQLVAASNHFEFLTLRDDRSKKPTDETHKPAEAVKMIRERGPSQGNLLTEKVRMLAAKYPLWLWDNTKANEPLSLFGATLETSFACAMIACVPVVDYVDVVQHPNGSWLVSEIDSNWRSNVQYFDAQEKQVYWLTLQYSSPARTDLNPYGIPDYQYREFLKKLYPEKKWTEEIKVWDDATIATDLTPSVWSRLKAEKVFLDAIRLTDRKNDGEDLVKQMDIQIGSGSLK